MDLSQTIHSLDPVLDLKKKEISTSHYFQTFSIDSPLNTYRSTEANAKLTQQPGQLSNLPKPSTKPIDVVREKGRRYKNVTIGDGICQSIDIRNSASAFGIMKDCRVIEGFLQIVLIENNSERDFQSITFPKLREITGYLLLYRVNGLKSFSNLFPNLEVIRGNILLTDYAFMVYEMQNLQEVSYQSTIAYVCSFLLYIFLVLYLSRAKKTNRDESLWNKYCSGRGIVWLVGTRGIVK